MAFKNYQLYRTTPLLSGNMQIDLILGADGITDLHLSPISHNIAFAPESLPDLLQQTHQVNISRFFKSTRSKFFTESIDYQLDSDWFIISEKKEKNWDDTYFAGTARTTKVNYGTQYSALVPCWIEKLDRDAVLAFKITVTAQGHTISDGIYALSGDIKDYLYNYFEYINLYEGNSRAINIDILSKQAAITGIDLESGNYVTTQANELIKNMMLRERPLIENDAQLTNIFKENKMILPQLLNFNLCFNITELIDASYRRIYDLDDLIISIEAGEYGTVFEPFDKSDFYTNYEFVPTPQPSVIKNGIMSSFIKASNVLDYLQDNKSLPLAHQNKICQPIVHWSLCDYNDYLFNFYDGFGSVTIDLEKTYHNYGMPDSYLLDFGQDFTGFLNPILDCGTEGLDAIRAELEDPQYALDTTIDKTEWVGHYSAVTTPENVSISLMTLDISTSPFSPMTESINWNNASSSVLDLLVCGYDVTAGDIITDTTKFDKPDNNLWLFAPPDSHHYVIFSKYATRPGFTGINGLETHPKFAPSLNIFDIKSFIGALGDDEDDHDYSTEYNDIHHLCEYFATLNPGQCIVFRNTIIPSENNTLTEASEINYLKATTVNPRYVFRLDGDIRPTFLSERSCFENYFWVKKIVKKEDFQVDRVLSKYVADGVMPIFASVGYDSMIKNSTFDYGNVPALLTEYSDEYKWFNKSKIHQLNDNLEYEIITDVNDPEIIEQTLYRKFKNDQCSYSSKLFNYRIQWYRIEYEFIDYIDGQYIFNVKMTLK